jgi:hypothetical protein
LLLLNLLLLLLLLLLALLLLALVVAFMSPQLLGLSSAVTLLDI